MPLKVIGAGVGRTGTTSLKLALERLLGGPCYHMYEVTRHDGHTKIWHDAIRGTAPDWDRIYDGFVATVDWPGAAFWHEISKAYPDALVLLTTRRSAEAWFDSANPTIGELLARPPEPAAAPWHAMATDLLRARFTPVPFDRVEAEAAYERHNAEVRATIPAERLLEWQPGDGWEPLCERFGVPVPDEPFPHMNTGDDFRAFLESLPTPGAPKIGVTSAWFDPEDPVVWSGVPRGLVDGLRRLGVYAGHHEPERWLRTGRLIHRWLRLTRRVDGWPLRPEVRLLGKVAAARSKAKVPKDVDAWVHFVGGYGELVPGRYTTFFEMSPTQLLEGARTWGGFLGYPGASPRQLAWVAREQERVYRAAFACCVASRWAADSLVRDHGIDHRKIHVVGYGRNADVPAPADRDWSTPRFLLVGRDWNRKNGDAVVRAFTRVRQEIPDARLDLVGDHPAVDVEGVTGHGLVEISDPVGRARLGELWKQATCFVLPSRFEPFGIVYVEAAAAGLASIAGNVGGTADSVGDGGRRVDPYDEEAIYRAMLELADPDAAQELGAVASARAEHLTWAKTAERVVRVLDVGPVPGFELAELLG